MVRIINEVNVVLMHNVRKSLLFNPWVNEANMGNNDMGSIATKMSTKFSKKRFNISLKQYLM